MSAKAGLYSHTRLDEIARLKLYENEVDEILNGYAKQAATELNMGIGLVTIVMDEAQKFAGSFGLEGWLKEANGTPVEWSFCANSVESKKAFIVEDATINPRVKDNPLVTQDGIRCYAGAPIITKNNEVIGNFCVLGTSTREFSDEEIATLKRYAKQVSERLEERIQ